MTCYHRPTKQGPITFPIPLGDRAIPIHLLKQSIRPTSPLPPGEVNVPGRWFEATGRVGCLMARVDPELCLFTKVVCHGFLYPYPPSSHCRYHCLMHATYMSLRYLLFGQCQSAFTMVSTLTSIAPSTPFLAPPSPESQPISFARTPTSIYSFSDLDCCWSSLPVARPPARCAQLR